MEFCYFPILKSRDSELRAYQELTDDDKRRILPIVELTRSRITQNNQNGSVEKKMEEIASIFVNNYFILDLTTEKTLGNDQIYSMLSHDNGYEKWTTFIKQYQSRFNFIPCIHYDPDHLEDVLKQIDVLSSSFSILALRLNALDEDNRKYLKGIKESHLAKCIVILDAENQKKDFDFSDCIKTILDLEVRAIIYVSSSFPPTVPKSFEGKVEKYDLGFHHLYREFSNVYYGDYALTAVRRYDMQARGWIPRIDIPIVHDNKSMFWYCRYRTSDTRDTEMAYIECAKKLYDEIWLDIDEEKPTWGERILLDAKDGYVAGKSPSFWISVRINIYISRMILNCEIHSRNKLKIEEINS